MGKDERGHTPLLFSAVSEAVAQMLITTGGANVRSRDIYGQEPLHAACINLRAFGCHQSFDASGASVNAVDTHGLTSSSLGIPLSKIQCLSLRSIASLRLGHRYDF